MVNQVISAARYNALQGRIAALLGAGAGDKGYNNVYNSRPRPVGNEVTVADMNNLFTDFRNVYVHIYGALPTTITTVTTANEITEALHAAYETMILDLENNRFTVDADYADVEATGKNSTRSTLWGGAGDPQFITHELTVTFLSANERRGFFNAGGEVRFSATLTPGTSSPSDPNYLKTLNWRDMLSAMGTVTFNYTGTSASGSGSSTTIGNLDLTSSYQTVFIKTGSSTYTDNEYRIEAKLDNDRTIRFKITFADDANGAGGADERVNGTLVSAVSQYRSTGIYVSSPAPVWVKTLDL